MKTLKKLAAFAALLCVVAPFQAAASEPLLVEAGRSLPQRNYYPAQSVGNVAGTEADEALSVTSGKVIVKIGKNADSGFADQIGEEYFPIKLANPTHNAVVAGHFNQKSSDGLLKSLMSYNKRGVFSPQIMEVLYGNGKMQKRIYTAKESFTPKVLKQIRQFTKRTTFNKEIHMQVADFDKEVESRGLQGYDDLFFHFITPKNDLYYAIARRGYETLKSATSRKNLKFTSFGYHMRHDALFEGGSSNNVVLVGDVRGNGNQELIIINKQSLTQAQKRHNRSSIKERAVQLRIFDFATRISNKRTEVKIPWPVRRPLPSQKKLEREYREVFLRNSPDFRGMFLGNAKHAIHTEFHTYDIDSDGKDEVVFRMHMRNNDGYYVVQTYYLNLDF